MSANTIVIEILCITGNFMNPSTIELLVLWEIWASWLHREMFSSHQTLIPGSLVWRCLRTLHNLTFYRYADKPLMGKRHECGNSTLLNGLWRDWPLSRAWGPLWARSLPEGGRGAGVENGGLHQMDNLLNCYLYCCCLLLSQHFWGLSLGMWQFFWLSSDSFYSDCIQLVSRKNVIYTYWVLIWHTHIFHISV